MFYQILSTKFLSKCMKISLEKLYVDIGSLGLTHRKIPKISPSMYKPLQI